MYLALHGLLIGFVGTMMFKFVDYFETNRSAGTGIESCNRPDRYARHTSSITDAIWDRVVLTMI